MRQNAYGITLASTSHTIDYLDNRRIFATRSSENSITSDIILRRLKTCSIPFFNPYVELFMRGYIVRARTSLINAVRGLVKSNGERLRSCSSRAMNAGVGSELRAELRVALKPLLDGIESLGMRIRQYDQQIEELSRSRYPEIALLIQVNGVGILTAITFILTLEDPHRFHKSRDAGCYVGLQPARRNSGQSQPQLHISKEGDAYLRTLLVQGAQHILGPFGVDSDLRRWGLRLAEHGGKSGKKRAIVAVARKLAVLLHRLWVSGEAYEPLRRTHQTVVLAA